MTLRSILVFLDPEQPSEAALGVARDLASQAGARLIGASAGLPAMPLYVEGMVAPSVMQADGDALMEAIGRCESRFREAVADIGVPVEWRTANAYAADWLADQARAADLVVVGRNGGNFALTTPTALDIGDAIMQAGRPVLVVPPASKGLSLERALIGWKDTPEARKAAAAALPLLKLVKNVSVIEIVHSDDEREAAQARIADVAAWLAAHKVAATVSIAPSSGDDGRQLEMLATENRAGLIVAGAYGHSRLREWILGGVTQRLLRNETACVLFAH